MKRKVSSRKCISISKCELFSHFCILETPPLKKAKKFLHPQNPELCKVTLRGLPSSATEKKIRGAAVSAKVKGLQSVLFEESENATQKSAVLMFETKGQAIIARQNFNKHGYGGL
jgi:hypothetical protein